MREFLLLIRSEESPKANLSPEQMQQHIEKVGGYLQRLTEEGRMKSAQPLEMEGTMLSYQNGQIIDGPYNETKEIISGYYHLLAKDMEEAVSIAKQDPRFDEGIWRVEVRPIKYVEGIN
ncbi:YciI family protein [Flagellimonas flava]|uniref:YciI family protein n=1 Tax=Flagellimonas flava TaxID=570519 RepID=UPI003D65608B